MTFLNLKNKKNKKKLKTKLKEQNKNDIKITLSPEEYNIINNINDNNNNGCIQTNSNNNRIKNWNYFRQQLVVAGFSESCILDLNTGKSESGFKLKFQEYQEILKMLSEGIYLISISCCNRRFYIVASSDLIIAGRDSNNFSFILRRTNNKCIIGIFDMSKLSIDDAHIEINNLYNKITNFDNCELFSNEII